MTIKKNMSNKIKKIKAREILDSRGNPTIEVKVELKNGTEAKASVPSGASTGESEAVELRDKDEKRYEGKGVLKVVKNVNETINDLLYGKSVDNQQEIDQMMIDLDGTKDKSKLGANAILGVSLACARVGSENANLPLYKYLRQIYGERFGRYHLPIPMMNIFNGGKHADTNLDWQEFMVVPALKEKDSFAERVRAGVEIFHELGYLLREKGMDTDIGNEGGYAPDISSSVDAVEMILKATKRANYKPGENIFLATDVGSATLYDNDREQYIFKLDDIYLNRDKMIELYVEWIEKYPFISIEDGLDEDDWFGWRQMTKKIGHKVMLVGDDLFTTNIERLKKGFYEKAGNALLVKPNQIGTLTETVECARLAQKNNYKIIVSHRSGETCDDFIADLAVFLGADYAKMGSLARGERVAKWNRLMEIEGEILGY